MDTARANDAQAGGPLLNELKEEVPQDIQR